MGETQDVAKDKPFTADQALRSCQTIKAIGADLVAVSTPYDFPEQAALWSDQAEKAGRLVWHRHSNASDEWDRGQPNPMIGWYGVPRNLNRPLSDLTNWIVTNGKKYPNLFKPGHIFTPKPEPQNMGILGVNATADQKPKFASAKEFNFWLRSAIAAATAGFAQLGIPFTTGAYSKDHINIGYFGFDGFIVAGYGNPDHQGKSVLEPETVQMMGNQITADHYPQGSDTMANFLKVFKQTWPGVDLILGEYGTTQGADKIQGVLNDIKADPIVKGLNYWELGPGKADVRLINDDYTLNPTGLALKAFYSVSQPAPVPTPIPPTPSPVPTPPPFKIKDILASPTQTIVYLRGSDDKFYEATRSAKGILKDPKEIQIQ